MYFLWFNRWRWVNPITNWPLSYAFYSYVNNNHRLFIKTQYCICLSFFIPLLVRLYYNLWTFVSKNYQYIQSSIRSWYYRPLFIFQDTNFFNLKLPVLNVNQIPSYLIYNKRIVIWDWLTISRNIVDWRIQYFNGNRLFTLLSIKNIVGLQWQIILIDLVTYHTVLAYNHRSIKYSSPQFQTLQIFKTNPLRILITNDIITVGFYFYQLFLSLLNISYINISYNISYYLYKYNYGYYTNILFCTSSTYLTFNYTFERHIENQINYYCYTYAPSYILNISLKFIQYLSSYSTILHINLNYYNNLTRFEVIFLFNVWYRLKRYNFYYTTIFFIREYIDMIYLGLKIRNFIMIHSYFQRILFKLIIWEHKSFFIFFFQMLTAHFYYLLNIMLICGIKIIIRGKIAVAGNSRRRKLYLNVRDAAKMNIPCKITYLNKLLITTTGALGFRIYIIFN